MTDMPAPTSFRETSSTASNAEAASRSTPANARKRKTSISDAGKGRATKHRSSQACQSCRSRKVRCDVLTNGNPCTNCRLDDNDCVVLPSRRGKNNHTRRDSNNAFHGSRLLTPRPSEPRKDAGPYTAATENDSRMDDEDMSPTVELGGVGDVPVCVTFDEDHQVADQRSPSDERAKEYAGHGISADHVGRGLPTPEGWPSEKTEVLSHPSSGPSTLTHHQNPVGKPSLPSFIAPLPDHMLGEDLDYLARKGAFTIPEPELRSEILQSYIFSVHPFMPMLDFPEVARVIQSDGEDGSMSLLLFQAIMFAGLASLDIHAVHRLGFESTKEARGAFFTRVNLLYEFDVEVDEIAVLQSLLMMSWWYGKWNQRRQTWYWTGLALSVAQNLGLHREPNSKNGSEKTRHFRRRLWWSLYIRDRLLALGTRRPMRIHDDSFNVAMLTLEDFDLQDVSDAGQARHLLPSTEEKKCSATMSVELAKLSFCIGHVLTSQYSSLQTQPNTPYTLMVVPKPATDRTIGELETCDRELNEWFHELGRKVRTSAPSAAQEGPQSCCEVHWAVLNMIYFTLVNVLHRTQAVQPSSDTTEAQSARNPSRAKVKDSARSITRIAYGLLRRDQARFLGVPGITALVATCLSHMQDIRSGDEDVRDASILRFYQSIQALQALRDIYASADSAVSFLASVIRKAGISMPAQVDTPAPEFMSASSDRLVGLKAPTNSSSSWKDSPNTYHGRRWTITEGQPYDASANWQAVDGLQSLSPSKLHTQTTTLLNPGQGLSPNSGNITPRIKRSSANFSALSPQFIAQNRPHTSAQDQTKSFMEDQSMTPNFGTLASGDPSDPAATASAPFFEWNNSLDLGIDLDSIDFDCDFSSDAFGFLHDQFQGL